MIHNLNEQVKEYGRRHRLAGRWIKIVAAMACVVVFCTAYALILPAVTLDQQTTCGIEEHTHSAESCYTQELICTDESADHVHSDACYESVLNCGLSEHQHTEVCYAEEAKDSNSQAVTAAKNDQNAGETAAAETAAQDTSSDITDGTNSAVEANAPQLAENGNANQAEDAADIVAEDGIAVASVTDNGSNSFTMAVGDTLTVNDYSDLNHTYVASYTSGSGWNRQTYYSSSSNTSVATLVVNNGTATVTAVGNGTSTVTLYYSTFSGWNTSYRSVTLNITVEGSEQAALYFMKSPTADPMTNDTGDWVPDSTKNQSQIIGTVNTAGAAWVDKKNITSNPGNYIVSWPDGSTNGNAWTIDTDNTYFNQILNLVFDQWKSELESELGISNLQKSDVTSITITPCKISKDNGTTPDKHIDCRIVLVSNKFFKTQFWVKEPGAADYNLEAYKFFKEGTEIPAPNSTNYSNYTYTYKIGDTKVVNGVTYVMTGWYTEDAKGEAHSDETASFAYDPISAELGDGIVNFYAEWVPATTDLTIVKYEKGDMDQLLSGAEFTLTNTNDSSKTYTFDATGENGETAQSKVLYGTYTLAETKAPDNYQAISDITVVVGDKVTISNAAGTGAEIKNDGKLWIPNEKAVLDVTIKKVDSANAQTALSGAVFELSGDGIADKTITTDENGVVEIKELPVGQYTLTETKAPDGYNQLTEKISLTVTSTDVKATYGTDGSNSIVSVDGTTVTIKNSAGESLPNTGGMGTGMYTFGGLAIAAIAILGSVMYSGRKRKQ